MMLIYQVFRCALNDTVIKLLNINNLQNVSFRMDGRFSARYLNMTIDLFFLTLFGCFAALNNEAFAISRKTRHEAPQYISISVYQYINTSVYDYIVSS